MIYIMAFDTGPISADKAIHSKSFIMKCIHWELKLLLVHLYLQKKNKNKEIPIKKEKGLKAA